MSRAYQEESGWLAFEDPVTNKDWNAWRDDDMIMFSDGHGANVWIRLSDAASIGDWLRRVGAEVDWRLGVEGTLSIPMDEDRR